METFGNFVKFAVVAFVLIGLVGKCSLDRERPADDLDSGMFDSAAEGWSEIYDETLGEGLRERVVLALIGGQTVYVNGYPFVITGRHLEELKIVERRQTSADTVTVVADLKYEESGQKLTIRVQAELYWFEELSEWSVLSIQAVSAW